MSTNPIISQTTHVRIEIRTTVGTKYADNLSANFWIGACKRLTISLFKLKQKDYQMRDLHWISGSLCFYWTRHSPPGRKKRGTSNFLGQTEKCTRRVTCNGLENEKKAGLLQVSSYHTKLSEASALTKQQASVV